MPCIVKPLDSIALWGLRLSLGATLVGAATIVKAATCAGQPGPRGPGRRGSIRSRGGELPADEKVGHCGGLHAAHGLEFAGPLTVKELAALAEDGEGRNPLAQRNPVALGDVEILVHVPDIDVNEDVVRFQD